MFLVHFMGKKTFVVLGIFTLMALFGGISLWNNFALGNDYPPSDHPASIYVDVQDIRIEDSGPVSFTSNYVLETRDRYYEFKLERRAQDSFTGRVMVTQDIDEDSPIIKDVLSARGTYADPEKTYWRVENHHFTWSSRSNIRYDKFRPYHLIPGSPEIGEVVHTISVGDKLKITGFDVNSFKVDATNPDGYGLFFDKGCRTMIVTGIEIS